MRMRPIRKTASGAVNPFRLDRSQAATADQEHGYTEEQLAFHSGLMDLFPKSVGRGMHRSRVLRLALNTTGLTMGYFDGNTVTALWNYAQRYSMSDNSFGANFGPSTPGAINLISGQTNGVVDIRNGKGGLGGRRERFVHADQRPRSSRRRLFATTRMLASMSGNNIGDLLTGANVTWGWFMGGFDLGVKNANGTTGCHRSSRSPVSGKTIPDYIPHHQPFQYYSSTANPTHARPTSVRSIGHNGDAGNHEYDIHDFYDAVRGRELPRSQLSQGARL